MNIKLHTPQSLKSGSGLSSIKQFFLSLIATTISIVLTFGTAAFIDYRKKEATKKEMVKMIIYDFDKTIEKIAYTDTALHEASQIQQELAVHPEYFDSSRPHPAGKGKTQELTSLNKTWLITLSNYSV